MPNYRFRLFDSLGRLVVGHLVHLADDSQAQAHADKLFAEGSHYSVEVRDNDRSVYRVAKRRSRS